MGGCPDFAFIRAKIPIAVVAEGLGLVVIGSRARCWRTDQHRNGDADPSIGFRRKQNTGRCFVCDEHTWSNLDLVQLVLNCDLRTAARWITDRYAVPNLAKGSHSEMRAAWRPRFRASDSAGNVVELLVRSGVWSALTHAERSLLPAFTTFIKDGPAPISYKGLMRYSGVGSTATVSKALKHFQQMGFLQVVTTTGRGGLHGVNRYCFTVDDPGFQNLLTMVFERQRSEIELEKTLRAEARLKREGISLPV